MSAVAKQCGPINDLCGASATGFHCDEIERDNEIRTGAIII